MNMELLQNDEVLMRILILFVPTAVAFVIAVIYLFISKAREESNGLDSAELSGAMMLFLPVCMTNFMYVLVELLLILRNESITADKIKGVPVAFFAVISVLSAASCLIKGIIGGLRLSRCVGTERQNGISKVMLFMAAAEVPGLISFALWMVKFIA